MVPALDNRNHEGVPNVPTSVNMVLKEMMGRECRKPTGTFGKLVARKMNRSHKAVTRWGLKFLDIGEGDRLLDMGCGGGHNLKNLVRMSPYAKVLGVDYSRDMVSLSRKLNRTLVRSGRLEVLEASVSRLPFRENVFDAVTAVETHFFWPDLINDLREVRRVMKPGSMVLIITEGYRHPDFEERNSEWERLSDFTMDTPEEFRGYLKSAGFERVESVEEQDRNWMAAWGRKPLK